MKASHTIRPVFDDPILVSAAGLVPALRLAETAGLHALLGQRLSVDSLNPVVKATSVVAGMLAGADSTWTWTCSATAACPDCSPVSGHPRR